MEHAGPLSGLLDPLQDPLPLRLERALVEVRVGFRVRGGTIGVERGGQCRVRSLASCHACALPEYRAVCAVPETNGPEPWAADIPVADAISAGVCSSTWLSVNTSRSTVGQGGDRL